MSAARPHGAPVLYTVEETRQILRIARSTLHRITQSGEIYAVKVGKNLRYPAAAVDAYIAGQPFDPQSGPALSHDDVSTWPPTPSLLSADSAG